MRWAPSPRLGRSPPLVAERVAAWGEAGEPRARPPARTPSGGWDGAALGGRTATTLPWRRGAAHVASNPPFPTRQAVSLPARRSAFVFREVDVDF